MRKVLTSFSKRYLQRRETDVVTNKRFLQGSLCTQDTYPVSEQCDSSWISPE